LSPEGLGPRLPEFSGAGQYALYARNDMGTAPRYQPHYSVADYSRWEGRWELWAGIAVAASPSPPGAHGKLLTRLVTALSNAIDAAACDATVLVGIDWVVSQNTVVRPDVTVVLGREPAGHLEATPALVAEVVSGTTRERDMVFKRALYEERGASWYLIADPDHRAIDILSLGLTRRYEALMRDPGSAAVTITLCNACRLTIDLAQLFR
jgi:Uma2 family endonuclease